MRDYCGNWEYPNLPIRAFNKRLGLGSSPATLEGGGGKGDSAPSYPDPYQTAQATTQSNQATAAYNKALNLNNYSNPFGSQNSTQVGTDPKTGAPLYNTTISANPQLQQSLNSLLGQVGNSGDVNSSAMGGLTSLIRQFDNLKGGVGSDLQSIQNQYLANNNSLNALRGSIDPAAAINAQNAGAKAAYASQAQYLDPQFAQQQKSLDADLANKGVTAGSEAFNNAQNNQALQKQRAYSDASNQATLTGSQIGSQNLQNQLNQLSAQSGLIGQMNSGLGGAASTAAQRGGLLGNLMNSQGAMLNQKLGIGQLPYQNLETIARMIPGYAGPSQSGTSPVDLASLFNNKYQSQLANYNAGQSSSNSLMGGLFGLGSSALMGGGFGGLF